MVSSLFIQEEIKDASLTKLKTENLFHLCIIRHSFMGIWWDESLYSHFGM